MKRYIIILICLLGLLSMGFSWGLPKLQMPEESTLYDINGHQISSGYRQNRIQVGLNSIADSAGKAFIATEDKNFYKHHGIDIRGILRALYEDIVHGRVVEGGSTITQQTAKNLYLTNERTLWRKIKELFYTFALEIKYSKDEILKLYLNSIYFGEGATGIESASRTYFGKSAADLTLGESAVLASIPRRPSYYDPYLFPEHAKNRQAFVLSRMVAQGYITQAQAEAATKQKLVYRRARYIPGDAPYFAQMVYDYLTDKYGAALVYGGGLKVYTTLDLDMQKAAQASYEKVMGAQNKDLQAAMVAVDTSNGQIRAMIGGRNFDTAPFNRAVNSRRQPGSSFKPFLYSKALEQGYTEAYMIMCEPVTFYAAGSPDYTPTDYGTEPYHYRAFTLKEAIMVSDNVVSVQLNDAVGPAATADHARRFGFKGDIRPVISLALGTSEVSPAEMAGAYAVFANGGVYHRPLSVLRVLDRNGNVLEENKTSSVRIIDQQNAYLVTDMLKGVLQPGGTASFLASQVGRTAAGKTGTTQLYRDAWFVGYTPELACSVWVGYDTQTRSVGIPGGQIAGPIWAGFMNVALKDVPDHDFNTPDGITKTQICMDSGLIATESCPRTMEAAFINGTEPQETCYLHQPASNWWNWGNTGGSTNPWQAFQDHRMKDRVRKGIDWLRQALPHFMRTPG